jgi:hypothetical protein
MGGSDETLRKTISGDATPMPAEGRIASDCDARSYDPAVDWDDVVVFVRCDEIPPTTGGLAVAQCTR